MSSPTILNAMTYSNLGLLIPVKFAKNIRDDRRARAFWAKFAGKEGSQSAVIEKEDLTKEAGDQIHFETISELYKPGVSGETELSGQEEKYQINRFTAKLEVYRHAVAVTHKGNSMAIIDSIQRAEPKLGRWFAAKDDDLCFFEIFDPSSITGTPSVATLYGGTATSDATLGTTSRLSPDTLDMLQLAMRRQGALPIQVVNSKGDDAIEIFCLCMDEVSWYWLQANATFRSTLTNSLPRGYDHPLFTGAKGMYNGILLKVHQGIHMGCHQGTAQRPEVALVGNHSGSATTITVGDSSTGYDYTKYFPQGTSGVDFTAIVYADGTNATEVLTGCNCAANNYQITCSSSSTAHLAGSRLVYQGHRSRLVCFGAETMVRAWGEKATPITQTEDFGFKKGVGLMSTEGHALIENSAGNAPNVAVVHVYADLPNLTSITL